MLREIQKLDVRVYPAGQMVPFALKNASAQLVATIINNLYAGRYNESQAQHQVRAIFYEGNNNVYIQASPADMAEIEILIERIDSTVSKSTNELRVIPLRRRVRRSGRHRDAGGEPGCCPRRGSTSTRGPAQPQAGAGVGAGPGGIGAGGPGAAGQVQIPNQDKAYSLRFIAKDGKLAEAGILDDIRITSEPRINALIISAPKTTMDLILGLVRANWTCSQRRWRRSPSSRSKRPTPRISP